jgi:hypothetical protein
MLIQAVLASGTRGVLLENMGGIVSVTCSPDSILVDFAAEASATVAQTWPAGTVLFTRFDGCNLNDERGVYILSGPPTQRVGANGLSFQFPVTKSTLQKVVDELDISYGQLVSGPNGNQLTSYTTTVTSYYTNSQAGTLTSSTFVSTITPSLTTMTYTSTTTSVSDSASIGAPSSTGTWALSPSAQAILDELSAGLPAPDADGTINIPIKKANDAILPVQPLTAEPYNEDPQYQAALQAVFAADLLDPPETLLNDAANALAEEAEPNVTADSPVQLVVSEYAGTDDAVYDAAKPVSITTSSTTPLPRRHTPARAASAPVPGVAVNPSDVTRLRGRDALAKRDGWDTFFAVMGDDAVGEICELCGAMYVFPNAVLAVSDMQ